MNRETIIDTDDISMWYYPYTKVVHHQFHKYLYGETLRNALDIGVEQLEKNRAHKWLSDDRTYTALPKEDIEWGVTHWGPAAVKAGWRFWAIVLPKSVVGQLSHRLLIDTYGALGVTVEVFSDSDEAMKWLEAQ